MYNSLFNDNNNDIESTSAELPEIRDIGQHVDVEDELKYELLKNPWFPSSNFNFPLVSKEN